MSIALKASEPFARGGNRLCFVHPDYTDRCVKVRRPDRSLEQRRAKKGFPKNLQPLSAFDDNLEEYRVMQDYQRNFPAEVFRHISRCYGFVETDYGKGLCSELILDDSGEVSMSLKLYLWHYGYTDECRTAVHRLMQHWVRYAVPSRDLLVHNIVVQKKMVAGRDVIDRLVVIDGLGATGFASLPFLPMWARRYLASRKANSLEKRIAIFLDSIKDGVYPGLQGVPMKDGAPNIPPPKQKGRL
jgi:hypothetical protein